MEPYLTIFAQRLVFPQKWAALTHNRRWAPNRNTIGSFKKKPNAPISKKPPDKPYFIETFQPEPAFQKNQTIQGWQIFSEGVFGETYSSYWTEQDDVHDFRYIHEEINFFFV